MTEGSGSMTRHHVIAIAIAIFIASGAILHQPGASSIETGIVSAYIAGMYLGAVAYFKDRMV